MVVGGGNSIAGSRACQSSGYAPGASFSSTSARSEAASKAVASREGGGASVLRPVSLTMTQMVEAGSTCLSASRRASTAREAEPVELFGEFINRPILLEQLEHHFTPLRKGAFYNLHKRGSFSFGEQRDWPADQANTGRINVGGREKTACRDFEGRPRFIIELNQQGKESVIRRAGSSHETLRNLDLKCGHD